MLLSSRLADQEQARRIAWQSQRAASTPGCSSPAYLLLDRADLGYSTTGEEITHTVRNAPPDFADGILGW